MNDIFSKYFDTIYFLTILYMYIYFNIFNLYIYTQTSIKIQNDINYLIKRS